MADLVTQIASLKKDVATAAGKRIEAEATLKVANERLAQVEADLRALGIEPDQAETELASLETALAALVTDLQAKVEAEIAQYQQIIRSGK